MISAYILSLTRLILGRSRKTYSVCFPPVALNVKNLRKEFIVELFYDNNFFRSRINFEFSLNAVECVFGRVFRK